MADKYRRKSAYWEKREQEEKARLESSKNYNNQNSQQLFEDEHNQAIRRWLQVGEEQEREQAPTQKPEIAYNPHERKRNKKNRKKNVPKLTKEEYYQLSKKEQKRYRKARKKPSFVKKFFKFIFILLMISIVLAGALGVYVWSLLGKIDTLDIGADLGISAEAAQNLANYENILIAGVDARPGESYENTRTDAIMILSLDKVNREYRLISVYRDTLMEVETEEGETYLGKINSANTEGGIHKTVKALNKNMDLNIDEVVELNWEVVAQVVDGLGGVEIEIKDYEIEEMNKYIYDTAENIGGPTDQITSAGVQNLNGVQAVTYARIRKVGNADFERTERMRVLVEATISKAFKTNPITINDVANDAADDLVTSLDRKEILTLGFDLYRYDAKDSMGWPYLEIENGEYLTDTAIVDGASTVVPRTLYENVIRLQEEMFGQSEYVPSDTVDRIDDAIIWETGLY